MDRPDGVPSHRAGWYTPHWLDRLTFGIKQQSADRIVPELQQLEVGDHVPDSVGNDRHRGIASNAAWVLRVRPRSRVVDRGCDVAGRPRQERERHTGAGRKRVLTPRSNASSRPP